MVDDISAQSKIEKEARTASLSPFSGTAMKVLDSLKNQKRLVLSLITVLGLFSVYRASQTQTQHLKRIDRLSWGLNTCFNRVRQSYFSRPIEGPNSAYLSPQFLETSLECFKKFSSQIEEFAYFESDQFYNQSQELLSQSYWFQNKLVRIEDQTKASALVVTGHLGDKFQQIEKLKNKMSQELRGFSEGVLGNLKLLNHFFYLLAIFGPFIFLWDFFAARKLEKENKKLEERAASYLSGQKYHQLSDVRTLIKEKLNIYGPSLITKLLEDLSMSVTSVDGLRESQLKVPSKTIIRDSDYAPPIKRESPSLPVAPPFEQEDAGDLLEEVVDLEVLNLEEVVSQSIEGLSSHMLAQAVDLKWKQLDHKVFGNPEALHHGLHNLLLLGLKGFKEGSRHRHEIQLKTQQYDKNVEMEIFFSQISWEKETLNQLTEFLLAEALVKEQGMKLRSHEVRNADDISMGHRFVIQMRAIQMAKVPRKRKKQNQRKEHNIPSSPFVS